MNKPLDQSDTCEVPVEISVTEQCEATLLHYERLADLAHEWNNQVPQAIRAWYAAINASPGSGGQAQINAAPQESAQAAIPRSGVPESTHERSQNDTSGTPDGAAPSTAGGQDVTLWSEPRWNGREWYRVGSSTGACDWNKPAAAAPSHSDHPLRHWDKTCPACLQEAAPSGPTEMELDYANEVLVGGYDGVKNILASAVLRWKEQSK